MKSHLCEKKKRKARAEIIDICYYWQILLQSWTVRALPLFLLCSLLPIHTIPFGRFLTLSDILEHVFHHVTFLSVSLSYKPVSSLDSGYKTGFKKHCRRPAIITLMGSKRVMGTDTKS